MNITLNKPIVIIGITGSGKSTIGKELAKKTQTEFYDSNSILEGREGLSISDIQEYMGLKYFQQRERETIKEILSYGQVVLSTGSDSFLNQDTREYIKSHSTCIWLHASIQTVVERISRRHNRLKLSDQNVEKTITDLMNKSLPYFREAHIKIDSNSEAHNLVHHIISRIGKMDQV